MLLNRRDVKCLMIGETHAVTEALEATQFKDKGECPKEAASALRP